MEVGVLMSFVAYLAKSKISTGNAGLYAQLHFGRDELALLATNDIAQRSSLC